MTERPRYPNPVQALARQYGRARFEESLEEGSVDTFLEALSAEIYQFLDTAVHAQFLAFINRLRFVGHDLHPVESPFDDEPVELLDYHFRDDRLIDGVYNCWLRIFAFSHISVTAEPHLVMKTYSDTAVVPVDHTGRNLLELLLDFDQFSKASFLEKGRDSLGAEILAERLEVACRYQLVTCVWSQMVTLVSHLNATGYRLALYQPLSLDDFEFRDTSRTKQHKQLRLGYWLTVGTGFPGFQDSVDTDEAP